MLKERPMLTRRQSTPLGLDERNIARLGLILAPNRIDSQMRGWRKHISEPGMPTINVICIAGQGGDVPHGIDADLVFALTSLYYKRRAGAKYIQVSLLELAKAMGLKPGGTTYRRIEQGLLNLMLATYHAISCWSIGDGKIDVETVSFRLLNTVRSRHVEEADLEGRSSSSYQPNKMYELELNSVVASSIDEGFTRLIDMSFYAQLERPLSRYLYRTLEEWRVTKGEFEIMHINLAEWAEQLGLKTVVKDEAGQVSTKRMDVGKLPVDIPVTRIYTPDKIRAALSSAHEELVESGYMHPPAFTGRGQRQIITYTFGRHHDPALLPNATPAMPAPAAPSADPEIVRLLVTRGVTPGTANDLAVEYGPERVRATAAAFDQYPSPTPRNRGGLMRDMLQNPSKYETLLPDQRRETPTRVRQNNVEDESMPAPELKAFKFLTTSFPQELHGLLDRLQVLYMDRKITASDLSQLKNFPRTEAEKLITLWEENRTAVA